MKRVIILIGIILTIPFITTAQYSLPNIPDAATLEQLQTIAPPEFQDSLRQLQELQRLLENPTIFNESVSPGNGFPLDLLWRAETLVPPGFRGKALPVAGSQIIVQALTPTQNPAQLEYTWIVEDYSSSIQGPEVEGRGLDSFTFSAESKTPNFTHQIKVVATNPRTGDSATARLEIPVKKGEVHLYTDGLWPRRINSRFSGLPGETITLVAKPFYFIAANLAQLNFSWRVGDEKLASDNEPGVLRLNVNSRTPLGAEQTVAVTVEPVGNRDFRQQARISSQFIVGP